MTRETVLKQLNDFLPQFRREFDVKELALFGSVARNENSQGSDVDVLVTFEHRPTFDNYMGLKVFLEEAFERRVDLVIREDIRKELKSRIEREALYVS